jgi:hypothetical protein
MPHSTYSKKKSFHLLDGTMNFFGLKVKNGRKCSIFRKTVFVNRSQIFIAFPRLYATQIMKFRQNHWSLISINPFINKNRVIFFKIDYSYEQTALFTTSHLRSELKLKRQNKRKKRDV